MYVGPIFNSKLISMYFRSGYLFNLKIKEFVEMVKMGIIKECGVSQQFQRGAYIQVQRFRCGKKGFGLKVMENVCKDSFIIEYIGEVCVH